MQNVTPPASFFCRLDYLGCGEMIQSDQFPVALPWQVTVPTCSSLINCKVICVDLNCFHDYGVEREVQISGTLRHKIEGHRVSH